MELTQSTQFFYYDFFSQVDGKDMRNATHDDVVSIDKFLATSQMFYFTCL